MPSATESFLERRPVNGSTARDLARWKQMRAEWDITVLLAQDGKTLLALGLKHEYQQLSLLTESA